MEILFLKMAFQVPHSTSLGVRAEISALQKRGEQMRKLMPPACYCSKHLNSPNSQMCCLPNVLPWKPLHTGYVNQFWGAENIACYPKQKKATSLGLFSHSYSTKTCFDHLTPIQRPKKKKKKHHALRSSSSIQRSDRLWSKVVSFASFGKQTEQ